MNELITLTRPERNFYVAKSKIENAGNGLFANEYFEPNTILFIAFALRGDNGKTKEGVEKAAAAMHTRNDPKRVWEADYIQLFPNDFINHNPDQANVESLWLGDFVVVASTRPIAKYEELYKDYRKTMKLITDMGFIMIDDYLNF